MPHLIAPCAAYADSYAQALEEGLGEIPAHPDEIIWIRGDFSSWLAAENDMRRKIILADGRAIARPPFSTFWLVENRRFLGRVNIRHRLVPGLEKQGGHIGYAIRAGARGQGHGHTILRLACAEARKIGLTRVLLTCAPENRASIRIIEKAGGLFQDTARLSATAPEMNRYWIDLSTKGSPS